MKNPAGASDTSETLYVAFVDNPPVTCEDYERGGDSKRDSIIYFTGADWGKAAAQCRADDAFLGGLVQPSLYEIGTEVDLYAECEVEVADLPTESDLQMTRDAQRETELAMCGLQVPAARKDPREVPGKAYEGPIRNELSICCGGTQTIGVTVGKRTAPGDERQVIPPPDALGYCIVNEGTPSEYVTYSVCGQRDPGEAGCERTLQTVASSAGRILTSDWRDCPNSADKLCPAALSDVDECLKAGTPAGDGKSYATYVDLGLTCDGDWPDQQNTLLVTTGSGWDRRSATCVATAPFDPAGKTLFGIGKLARGDAGDFSAASEVHSRAGDDFAVPGPSPLGYCRIYPNTLKEYVLLSLCGDKADLQAQCTGSGRIDTEGLAAPEWVDCSNGGDYCFP